MKSYVPRTLLRTALVVTVAIMAATTPATAQTFDHGAWNRLVQHHVVKGMVDYPAFRTDPDFPAYLQSLARQDPSLLSVNEQLAFWINAYNAYTVQLILKHNETKSIRQINKTFGLKLKGPWSEDLAVVGGTAYTLDHIEHEIIRPTFREPRIHFALVCAAMGCPPLRSEAYTGSELNRQLDDQGAEFLLHSPEKNRVDVATRTFYHSWILGYYKKDFGGSLESAAKFVARWFPAGSPERAVLEKGPARTVETDYDWTLNSQANARATRKR